ncbi:MAG: ribonuclease J [Acetobacteraceae bacterium]|nr:ribonuclease J [Acetobacteraceae bacterium]MBV8525486.1 ribonuclease J [Acetobacteraceae bacterium]MBV8588871.1 ribonuclease J [Acetobacteraceae bacterium]
MEAAKGDLAFLPLGGTGEIGMNFNLYRCGSKWLAVDCGIGFGGVELPEAEILVPDPAFIAERRERLVGLVITHAHEDHIGGVAWLWPYLRCAVYATPFAAAVLRRKLAEVGRLNEVPIRVVPPGAVFELGPFSMRFLRVAHSIPEAQALAISTPHGTILHTGDWKLDPDPLIGPPTSEAEFAELGERGVLAMVCDSTNAMVEGHSGSEAEVRRSLGPLIRGLRGRVAVTCFASNIARIESIARAAESAGRSVAIVGRSLRNLEEAARECGYLRGVPAFVPEDAAGSVPDDHLLLLVGGSQGEPRSALTRIALDSHPNIALGEGDTVVFSSRVIPGNERAIRAVQDNLIRRGVRLMTDEDHLVHVSGHPARDELRRLYRLVRPHYVVPTHGEWRHLAANAALAQEMGAVSFLLEDGDVLSLAPGRPEVVDTAPVGRLAVDSGRLVPLSGGVMSARRRMLFNGMVLASVAVDGAGRVRGRPRVSAPGLFMPDDPENDRIAEEFTDAVESLPMPLRREDDALREAARAALRRALGRRLQKRPLVDVHLLRV